MAVTVAEVERRQSLGNYLEKIVDVTFDNSYATNGEPLAAADVGLATILAVLAPIVQGAVVRHVAYDVANAKLLAYAPGGAEIANTTDLSAVTVRLVVRGRG